MERDEPSPISAAQARQKAHENLAVDNARWGLIKPLTGRLKALRIERIQDTLAEEMRKAWGDPR